MVNLAYTITYNGAKRRQKHLNTIMKPIKDPFMTTVRNLKTSSGTQTRETLRKIEEKIVMYGLCSDAEYSFYQRFGKTELAK